MPKEVKNANEVIKVTVVRPCLYKGSHQKAGTVLEVSGDEKWELLHSGRAVVTADTDDKVKK